MMTCGRCGITLVECPGLRGWWISAAPGPGRGECPQSLSGHQAWLPEVLARVQG